MDWKRTVEGVNKWILQLQRVYDEDKLEEEVKAIIQLISEEEFAKYFKTKDKPTKSSPSGGHIFHYKLIL